MLILLAVKHFEEITCGLSEMAPQAHQFKVLVPQLVELWEELGKWPCWRCVTRERLWGFKSPCHSHFALSPLPACGPECKFLATATIPCLPDYCYVPYQDGSRMLTVLVRVIASMKRQPDQGNSNKRKHLFRAGLQFQRFRPLSSRQEVWQPLGRLGAGGAESSTTWSWRQQEEILFHTGRTCEP